MSLFVCRGRRYALQELQAFYYYYYYYKSVIDCSKTEVDVKQFKQQVRQHFSNHRICPITLTVSRIPYSVFPYSVSSNPANTRWPLTYFMIGIDDTVLYGTVWWYCMVWYCKLWYCTIPVSYGPVSGDAGIVVIPCRYRGSASIQYFKEVPPMRYTTPGLQLQPVLSAAGGGVGGGLPGCASMLDTGEGCGPHAVSR